MLTYIPNSDITHNLPNDKNCLLAHCCNDVGGWGAGVVRAISSVWPNPEKYYRKWYKNTFFNYQTESISLEKFNFYLRDIFGDIDIPFVLGQIQPIPIACPYKGKFRHYVVNMIGQRDIIPFREIPPVRYEALRECFIRLNDFIVDLNFKTAEETEVHMPKLGAGLAGGDWNVIEKLLNKYLRHQKIFVHLLDK